MSSDEILNNDLSDINEYINTVKADKLIVNNPFDELEAEMVDVSVEQNDSQPILSAEIQNEETVVVEDEETVDFPRPVKEFKVPSYIPTYIPEEDTSENISEVNEKMTFEDIPQSELINDKEITVEDVVGDITVALNNSAEAVADSEDMSISEELTDTADELTDTADELTDTADELTDTTDELTDTADEHADTADELTDTVDEPADTADEPAVTSGEINEDRLVSEIPVGVDTMGMVIDKAPSLNTEEIEQMNEEINPNDINDLMANLMSSIDNVDEKADEPEKLQDIPFSSVSSYPEMVMDEETIQAGKALEEYLNSPVESLINHPDMPASLGFDIPSIDDLDNVNSVSSADSIADMDFPILPQAPEIPVMHQIQDIPLSDIIGVADFSDAAAPQDMTVPDNMFIENVAVSDDTVTESAAFFDDTNAENTAVSDDTVTENAAVFDDTNTENTAVSDDAVTESAAVFDDTVTENTAVFDDKVIENIAVSEDENISEDTAALGSVEQTSDTVVLSADIEDIKKELAENADDDNDDIPDETDIEKLLARAQQGTDESNFDNLNDMSLEELLASSNDSETDQINSLLDKADRNEAVDEGIAALLSGSDFPPINLGEDGIENNETLDPKQAKKAEKQRIKEEKKEAKRKAKEAKLAAKKAKKDAANDPGIEKLTFEPNENDNNIESPIKSATYDDMSDIDALLTSANSPRMRGDEDVDAVVKSAFYDDDSEASKDESSKASDSILGDLAGTSEETPVDEEALALAGLFGDDAGLSMPGDLSEDTSEPENIIGEAGSISDDLDRDMSAIEGIDGSGTEGADSEQDELADLDDSGKGKKKKKKSKKFGSNSDEASDDLDSIPEKGEKKTNPFKAFFGNILDFINEEDDDDEKSEIILSDENAAILDELDSEQGKGKKSKKKAKKGKQAEDGDDERAPEKKPKKKKKEKKPKKAKDSEDGPQEPKISKKKISMVALVCIMLAAAIFIVTYFMADFTVKKSGRDAYNNGDYQTCYQHLYGKKLSASEAIMYNQSECILKINLWLREYEVYAEENQETKALDSLIQSVNSYPYLKESAEEWGCADKVGEVYNKICGVLNSKYSLSVDDALAIAAEEDDVVYTRLVTAIASGVNYQDALNYIITNDISGTESIDNVSSEDDASVNMDDILPEEEGMTDSNFVEP